MSLPGVLMIPVTVTLGPSVSYNLLFRPAARAAFYAVYRVARLWLPSQAGAIAAGAFFGLSSVLVWRSWYHLNLAAGCCSSRWRWRRRCVCGAGPAGGRRWSWVRSSGAAC